MACSKYEYVKQFEQHKTALLDTYMVVRIDGRGFTKFCQAHKFKKPNDIRAIKLMNQAAKQVMIKFPQIFIAYGQSDQYSFAFPKSAKLFNRRIDKIQTCIVSYFTAIYVHRWNQYFQATPIKQVPSFDCRIVQYPNIETVKDYFRWRQVDCHINNLYNTVFWCMIQHKKMKSTQVEQALKITNSGDKNEILFNEFNINYNTIDPIYRKGTIFCYRLQQNMKKQKNPINLPKNIRKQIICSINQLKSLNCNMGKMTKKLDKSQIQEDLQNQKQLLIIQQQLKAVQQKYAQIRQRVDQNKIMAKQPKNKYKLQQIYEDLINQEFWEFIKIQ